MCAVRSSRPRPWRSCLLALALGLATAGAGAQSVSTTEDPPLSTTASTLRSLSAELVQRLDARRTQAAELSQNGTSIGEQLSGAMQSDELNSSELSAQSTITSQALADSVTASTATTTSLSDASSSASSLSEDLPAYVQQITRSRDLWRTAALVAGGIAAIETVLIILSFIL